MLNEVAHIKEIKQEVGKEFMSRNLPTRRAMNVFMGIESLDTLSNIEEDARFLYIFTFALNKVVNSELRIDVKILYTA